MLSLSRECAVTLCSELVEQGFRTCSSDDHWKLELHYYEHGKAMFQLKTRLEHLKLSQTHDSLPTPPLVGQPRLIVQNETMAMVTDLQPDAEVESDAIDDPPLEGSGDTDDAVLLDANGELCDGKPDMDNRKLRAQFGHKQSHNEELCVASCGILYGRQRFFGSEAPNGVRVSSKSLYNVFSVSHSMTDVCNVPVPHKTVSAWSNLA